MVNFISASNNIFIIIKKLKEKLYYITDYKSQYILYLFNIYFNTFVGHMGCHIARTLFALHVTLF